MYATSNLEAFDKLMLARHLRALLDDKLLICLIINKRSVDKYLTSQTETSLNRIITTVTMEMPTLNIDNALVVRQWHSFALFVQSLC